MELISRSGNGARPWRVRLQDGHRDTTRSFATKREAEHFLAEYKLQKVRDREGLSGALKPNISYEELCNLYLSQYSQVSKPWLEQMLSYSRSNFGPVRVRNLAPELLGSWLNNLSLSSKTKRHILTTMRQVLSAGVEWGYLTSSPARPRAVHAPRIEPTTILPFETWQEVLTVASVFPRWGPLIRFACSTGLRIEEWCALEWRDIDQEGRLLVIHRTYRPRVGLRESGKTRAALRRVALSRTALSALDDLPTPLRAQSLVFPGAEGRHLDVNKWRDGTWRRGLTRAGVAYRPPYQMRHTFATLALNAGCSLDWIAEQMGHTDVSVTRKHYARYLKTYDDRMLAILDTMEDKNESQHADRQNIH